MGAVWAPGRRPHAVFGFRSGEARITEVEILMDPELLTGLELDLLPD